MVAQATPQLSPFIVRQDVISQRGMAERTGLFRQAVDHMPEVDTPGPRLPFSGLTRAQLMTSLLPT
jgi:hypothetical protein